MRGLRRQIKMDNIEYRSATATSPCCTIPHRRSSISYDSAPAMMSRQIFSAGHVDDDDFSALFQASGFPAEDSLSLDVHFARSLSCLGRQLRRGRIYRARRAKHMHIYASLFLLLRAIA